MEETPTTLPNRITVVGLFNIHKNSEILDIFKAYFKDIHTDVHAIERIFKNVAFFYIFTELDESRYLPELLKKFNKRHLYMYSGIYDIYQVIREDNVHSILRHLEVHIIKNYGDILT